MNWTRVKRRADAEDLTGQKFGRLTALYMVKVEKGRGRHWLCKCECGNYHPTRAGRLTTGTTRSCGCLRSEMLAAAEAPPEQPSNPFEKSKRAYRNSVSQWEGPFLPDDSEGETYFELRSAADEADIVRVVGMMYRHGHSPAATAEFLGWTLQELDRWLILTPEEAWLPHEIKKREAEGVRQLANKRRLLADPTRKIRSTISGRVWKCLKRRKEDSIFEWLPYSLADLVAHLEALMLSGMTWANYGRIWHVDHKRPVSWFDWDAPDTHATLRECWALSNLQPLWASENASKGNRYEHT